MSTNSLVMPATLESERLQALHRYDILHSLQEDIFDELVELAARLYSLPVSLLNLIGEQHGWHHVQYGTAFAPQQPRAELLCSLVIKQHEVVVYRDLAAVPQTAANAAAVQATLAKKARFYAAAPLCMPDQHNIGSLCLLDTRPREFSPEEQQVLQHLADLVSQAIAVRQQYRASPALGEARWLALRTQVQEELHNLSALVRYLLTRYGITTPVPEEVLHLVSRRLQDLQGILTGGE